MHETTTPNEEQISVRPVQYEDIPSLSAMAGRLFWEAFTGKMPEADLLAYIAVAFTPEKMLIEWKEKNNTFLLAFFGQEQAGYAKINTSRRIERQEIEKYIEMERLYLFKQFHGKKIGAFLMNHCLQYAKDNGFDMIWLNVWERNTAAIEFYQRWGFQMVDWTIMMRGNDPQKALWMKKHL